MIASIKNRGNVAMGYSARIVGIAMTAAAVLLPACVGAQEVKPFRFAYDQPRNTGYSVAGDLFAEKLKELSKGAMIVDQYPGAQLGPEPQLLQLGKSGEIEFGIVFSAQQ